MVNAAWPSGADTLGSQGGSGSDNKAEVASVSVCGLKALCLRKAGPNRHIYDEAHESRDVSHIYLTFNSINAESIRCR